MRKSIFIFLIFFVAADLNAEQTAIENYVSFDSAVIIFTADTNCYSRLLYGEKENKLSSMLLQTDAAKKHKFEILNLAEGKKYYFKIEYYNKNFNKSSEINSFKVLGVENPEIKDLKLITESDKAYFNLKTNVPVMYEMIINDTNISGGKYLDNINIEISNLKPHKEYEYTLNIYNEKKSKFTETGILLTKEKNIGLNKKTEGTFTVNPEEKYIKNEPPIIERITDGRLNYFTGMATSGNIKNENQSVIIDLENNINIEKIKVYWRGLAYSKDYMILLSSDKKKWDIAATKIDASKGASAQSETGDPMFVNEIEINKNARYARLWIPQNSGFYCKHNNWNFVQLFEVEIINNNL
ncbi:MAG TPA: discoidin domain-containing protein [bacterium]|nr:discoidin domain-containing protein [bacterium]HPN29668.1 discoidin domain-containing protein [bacterium]